MCWNEPSMFIDSRFAFASCCVTSAVTSDADDRDDDDHAAVGLGRRDQPLDRAEDDQAGEHEQRRAVRLRGEDLGAAQAEGEVPLGGPADEPEHDQREQQRAGVGEHVRGVREQRERVGEDPRDHLGDHEGRRSARARSRAGARRCRGRRRRAESGGRAESCPLRGRSRGVLIGASEAYPADAASFAWAGAVGGAGGAGPYDAARDPRRPQRPRPAPLARRCAEAHRPRARRRGRLLRRLLRAVRAGRADARASGGAVRVPLEDAIPRDEARASPRSTRRCSRASASRSPARADDLEPGRVTAIMHLEGADPLAPDLSDLERLVRPRAPLDRHRLVAAERVRRGRAVPLPGLARHRARA